MAISFPVELETRDESFWKKQEKRKKGLLGQPCCTQSKMSWALIHMPGNFALVIHGEEDCLNCFHHHTGPSAGQVFSTRLTAYQITSGKTQRPLEHLLRLIVSERTPEAIIVLGTCPVEVIGDQFDETVDRLSLETGVPMAALHTSGLKMAQLAEMQDWLYETLADLADTSIRPQNDTFNLIGMPEWAEESPETNEVFRAVGITLNGMYPNATAWSTWRRIGGAQKSFVVDMQSTPKLVKKLESLEQGVLEIPLPIGAQQTTQFYATIADAFGVASDMDEFLSLRKERAEQAIATFRDSFRGTPIALTLRMLNTYRSDQLAYGGLGDFAFLEECGLHVSLFIQGPPEEHDRFASTLLNQYGVSNPVHVFPGPWVLGSHLRDRGFRQAIAPDSCTATLRNDGVSVIPSRTFAPFYAGIESSLRSLTRLFTEESSP